MKDCPFCQFPGKTEEGLLLGFAIGIVLGVLLNNIYAIFIPTIIGGTIGFFITKKRRDEFKK